MRQVRREEDHDQDAAELRRLERVAADPDPQPRAVLDEPDARNDRQEQQDQPCEADRVRVAVELPVIADHEQHDDERDDADDEPHRLFAGDRRPQPVEQRHAQAGEHRGGGEQDRIRPPRHDPNREPAGEERDADAERVRSEVARNLASLPETHQAVGEQRDQVRDEQQAEAVPRAPGDAVGNRCGAHASAPPPPASFVPAPPAPSVPPPSSVPPPAPSALMRSARSCARRSRRICSTSASASA